MYDTETGQRVLSWPLSKEIKEVSEVSTVLSKQEMEKQLDGTNKTGCTNHSHLNSTHEVPAYGTCQFERIIIRYGRLTFCSFQITPMDQQHELTPRKQSNQLEPKAWRGRFGAYEKKCENCQTNKSPEWRRGPSGHKT